MARPQGHELNKDAWEDLLRLLGTSLTEVSEAADIPRPTLSSLVGGHHRASVPQAHRIARALSCKNVGTLFPSLRGVPTVAAVG